MSLGTELAIIVVGAAAWFTLAFAVATFMARRGYDYGAWLLVGSLFGPVSLVFAVVELLTGSGRRPEVVRAGRHLGGQTDVLVVGPQARATARSAMDLLDEDVGRITFARVLPFDGPRDAEREATNALAGDAASLQMPAAQLVLLFGVPEDAAAAYARDERFEVVLAEGRDPAIRS